MLTRCKIRRGRSPTKRCTRCCTRSRGQELFGPWRKAQKGFNFKTPVTNMFVIYLSSSRPNSSTLFFQARSVIRSNAMGSFSLCTTQATPPIPLGSFRPFTGFPATNLSGLVPGGKYILLRDGGRLSKCTRDACEAFIEHQGASGTSKMSEAETGHRSLTSLKQDVLRSDRLGCNQVLLCLHRAPVHTSKN